MRWHLLRTARPGQGFAAPWDWDWGFCLPCIHTAPSYAHTTMQTMMMSSALQTPVCRPSRLASITSRPAVARPMRSSVVVRAEKGGPPPTVRHPMTRPPDRVANRRGVLRITQCLMREPWQPPGGISACRHWCPLQVVLPVNGDPFIGMFETPVTSSPLVAGFLSNLPAYRTQVSPLLRGTEIGLAHGFLVVRFPNVQPHWNPFKTFSVPGNVNLCIRLTCNLAWYC